MAFIPSFPNLRQSQQPSPVDTTISTRSSRLFGARSGTGRRIFVRPSTTIPIRTATFCSSSSSSSSFSSPFSFSSSSSEEQQRCTNGKNYMRKLGNQSMKDFLTSRSVRTLIYYFQEFNDGPSKDWLLKFNTFEQNEKNGCFHNGEHFIIQMMYTPKQIGQIVIQHPRGYFKRCFDFVIDPYQIAKRILNIREDLAKEWTDDLKLIEKENLQTSQMNFENLFFSSTDKSSSNNENNDDDAGGHVKCNSEEEDDINEIKWNEKEINQVKKVIFDENTWMDHTPLRYKNYQGLKKLCTRYAITRLLVHLRDFCNHEYMWLLQFIRSYEQKKKNQKNNTIGSDNDDHLLYKMMRHPYETRKNPNYVIVPHKLATQIMTLRAIIAEEWIQVLKQIPNEHLNLQKNLLELSMYATNTAAAKKTTLDSQDSTSGSSSSSPSHFDPSDN